MYQYVVIFHGSGHYYFGDSDGNSRLHSVLRLQSGSWTWSNVGQINSARWGHAVISNGEKFTVVGGNGNKKNEACSLKDGQFSCTKLSSKLYNYAYVPILFSVADNYGSC